MSVQRPCAPAPEAESLQRRAPSWMLFVALPGGLAGSYLSLMLGGLLMFKAVVPLNAFLLAFSRDGPPSPWAMHAMGSLTLLVMVAVAGNQIRRQLPRPAGTLFALGWYSLLLLAVAFVARLGNDAFAP